MENGNNNATEHKIPKGNDSLKKLIKKTFPFDYDLAVCFQHFFAARQRNACKENVKTFF